MVIRASSRDAWWCGAAGAALLYGLQVGCLFPSYTFDAPEPTGAGGATATSGALASSVSGVGGASTATAGTGGAPSSSASMAASGSATSGSSAAGTSGSSGAGGGGEVVIAPGNMIDDMEAGSANILQQNGRIGAWYTYNDGTVGATQTPAAGGPFLPELIVGGRAGSTEAAHSVAAGFTVWGSGLGFDLHNDGTSKQPYSVAAFTGIAFWARGSAGTLRFKALTLGTVAVAEGGECTALCGDSHGAIFALTPAWQQHVIPFAALKQQNWGTPAAWDPATVLSIQFQTSTGSLDVWVDDVGFY